MNNHNQNGEGRYSISVGTKAININGDLFMLPIDEPYNKKETITFVLKAFNECKELEQELENLLPASVDVSSELNDILASNTDQLNQDIKEAWEQLEQSASLLSIGDNTPHENATLFAKYCECSAEWDAGYHQGLIDAKKTIESK